MSYKNGSAFTGLAKEIEKMVEDAYRRGVADKEAEIASVLNMRKAEVKAPKPAPVKQEATDPSDEVGSFFSQGARIDLARLKAYGERERAKGRAEVMEKQKERSKRNGEKWKGWAAVLVNSLKETGVGHMGGPVPVKRGDDGAIVETNQKLLLAIGIVRDLILMSPNKVVATSVACSYATKTHDIKSASVHNALSLMVRAGYVERVCRGVYKATPLMIASRVTPSAEGLRLSQVVFDSSVPLSVAEMADLAAAAKAQE